jgi:hypothetical protein
MRLLQGVHVSNVLGLGSELHKRLQGVVWCVMKYVK